MAAEISNFDAGRPLGFRACCRPSRGAFVHDCPRADIFVSNLSGTVGEYTLSGSTVNASLIVAPPETLAGIAVSGSNVFVSETNGTIGEYTTSGGSLIGTIVTGGSGEGLVVSGSDLFVDNYNEGGPGTIGEYTTSGGTVQRFPHHGPQ